MASPCDSAFAPKARKRSVAAKLHTQARRGRTKAATRLRRRSPSTIPPESLLLVLFVVEEGRGPVESAASSEIPVVSELATDHRC
nr:hypothetical protein Itr_chr01CG03430 [Ipomoea trifida]